MKLTQLAVKNAKPTAKPYKLADGGGMYLLINPNGSKYWRLKYSFAGKERLLALGVYPKISLMEAREKREEAKSRLKEGVDPAGADNGNFEKLSVAWLQIQKGRWTTDHAEKIRKRIDRYLVPHLRGDISEITAKQILDAIRKVEDNGKTELAHRCLQYAVNIFQLAVIEGTIKYNPARELSPALKPHKSVPMRTISIKELPALLKAINASDASMVVKIATLLTLHVFLRSSELRGGKWSEIDWDACIWEIPASRMKMKEAHIVPLSRQSIHILKTLKQINGEGEYIFAALGSYKHKQPIISENVINNLLQDIGFGEKLVGHGFRALASTTLNELLEFPPDVIERQLAHRERNAVKAAYNRATYLKQRKEMMQAWSDYIDSLG